MTSATAVCDPLSLSPVTRLEFVKISSVRPHEIYTPDHEYELSQSIREEGQLRNPIIVTEVGPQEFLVLDGTHRLKCLESLGFSHVFVQVVDLHDATSVAFGTWSHLALVEEHVFTEDLEASGLRFEDASPRQAARLIRSGDAIACLEIYGQREIKLIKASDDAVSALRSLITSYEYAKPRRIALGDTDHIPIGSRRIFEEHGQFNLLVRFAPVPVNRIATLASDPIPAGITRLQVKAGRVLGVNVPLTLLESGALTYTQRQQWLGGLKYRNPVRHHGPVEVAEPTGLRTYAEDVISYDPSLDIRTSHI